MEYIVQFVNGDRVRLDQDGFRRMQRASRSMGNVPYAALADGTKIFYINVAWVAPEDHSFVGGNYPDDADYTVHFIGCPCVYVTKADADAIGDVVRNTANRPFTILKSGALVFQRNAAWIGPVGGLLDHPKEYMADEPKVEPSGIESVQEIVPEDTKPEKPGCCDDPQWELRYINAKTGATLFVNQCQNCGAKSRLIPKSSIEDPDAVLPVKE